MKKHIGEYIREEIRRQGFTDPEVAAYLNITKSAVEKIYVRDDINGSRIEKLCAFLKKDLFAFYYEKEPLKSIHHNTVQILEQEINSLKKIIAEKDEIIEDKKNIIEFMKKSHGSVQLASNETPTVKSGKKDKSKQKKK